MRKGFTLIELLAVIVILAIIALIATPIVLNIIKDTKESATLRSADFYVDALENEIMLENMKQGGSFNPKECKINEIDKKMYCDGKEITLKVDGEIPTSGSITFEEGKVTSVKLDYTNGSVSMNNKGELVLGESQEVELAPGLYDEKDNLIASWEELVDGYDIEYYIEHGDIDSDSSYVANIMEELDNAFKLVIDESVTSIGELAFWGCTNLTEIVIPNSVTSIGYGAFYECTSLTSITIPSSVTSIGELVFESCDSLTSIKVDENNPVYDSRDNSNAIIETATNTLIHGSNNTIIPNSVTSIGSYAFSGRSLTTITIPNSVTSIGYEAFNDCTSLTTIYYKGTATGSPWGAYNAQIKTNF